MTDAAIVVESMGPSSQPAMTHFWQRHILLASNLGLAVLSQSRYREKNCSPVSLINVSASGKGKSSTPEDRARLLMCWSWE